MYSHIYIHTHTYTYIFTHTHDFANYFINKIDKIYDKLTIKKTKLINLTKKKYLTTNAVLSTFDLSTITEIYNLIVTAKKSSPNNPLPLTITKLITSTLAPLFKIIIDESLTYGTIPDLLKLSLITSLLKKPKLDKTELFTHTHTYTHTYTRSHTHTHTYT